MTFAQIAEKLAKKKAEYTEKMNSPFLEVRNTAKYMVENRIAPREQALREYNQQLSQPQGNVPQFRKGGETGDDPQYRSLLARILGIEAEPGYDSRSRSIGNWFMRNSSPSVTWDDVPKQDATAAANPGNPFVSTPERPLLYSGTRSGGSFKAPRGPKTNINSPMGIAQLANEIAAQPSEVMRLPSEGYDMGRMTPISAPEALSRYNTDTTPEIDKLKAIGADAVERASKMPGKTSFTGKLDKAMPSIMQTAGILGSFVDNIANRRAINKMQGPAAPTYTPGVKLNTTYNINPQLAEAREAEVAVNRGIDNSMTSAGSATASKIGAFTNRLRETGRLYAAKENAENQMRNHETLVNSQINAGNVAMGNRYRQDVVDFNNMKTNAIAGNSSDFGQDLMNISSAYQQSVVGPKQQLEMLYPYMNKYGMMDKYYGAILERLGVQPAK